MILQMEETQSARRPIFKPKARILAEVDQETATRQLLRKDSISLAHCNPNPAAKTQQL